MVAPKKNDFPESDVTLAELARALSHPARIAILRVLAARRRCICGEIVDELPLSQSTVSQHLRALHLAGLIEGDFVGPKTCYCLNEAGIAKLQKVFPAFVGRIHAGVIKLKKCC
jgi:DNA-binding transcriptional ArsR family regulator